jgi:hypothetical protein
MKTTIIVIAFGIFYAAAVSPEQFAAGNTWVYSRYSTFVRASAYQGSSIYDTSRSIFHISISAVSNRSDTAAEFTAIVVDTVDSVHLPAYPEENARSQTVAADTVRCLCSGKTITNLDHPGDDTSWAMQCVSLLLVPQNAGDSVSKYEINNKYHAIVENKTDSTYYLKEIGFLYHFDHRFSLEPHNSYEEVHEIKLVSFNNQTVDARKAPVRFISNLKEVFKQTCISTRYDIKRDCINIRMPYSLSNRSIQIEIFLVNGKRCHFPMSMPVDGVLKIPLAVFPAGKYFLSVSDGRNNIWTSSFIWQK